MSGWSGAILVVRKQLQNVLTPARLPDLSALTREQDNLTTSVFDFTNSNEFTTILRLSGRSTATARA